jgi:hypothetical protein
MDRGGMQYCSNLKKKGVLKMKKTMFMFALVFVFGMGTAYAADFNGVTDFSGRSYDTFEIETDNGGAKTAYESSAPGSKRLVEDFNNTGKSYDTFEIEMIDSGKRVVEGSAPGNLRQTKRNYAGKESSVKAYDNFEIEMFK